MALTWLDDGTIERLVAGDESDARLGHLAAFVRAVRALGEGAVPAASPRLVALFAAGPTPGRRGGRRRRVVTQGLTTAAAKIAALGVAAKIGLGSAVAAAGVAGAGATGMLPDQASERVRAAIEAVTPVDFADQAEAGDRSRFGDRVSSDATGTSDDVNGVDGDQISDEAPGAVHRPLDPGAVGLDRANETPAAQHAPDQPGAETDASPGPLSIPPSTTPPSAPTAPSTMPPHGSTDR